MGVGRYTPKSARSLAQARIDAQREAARREAERRKGLAAERSPVTFRGAAAELQTLGGKHFEVVIKGPAETGKTYAACYFVDSVLRAYAGAQWVLGRKVRDTIYPTVYQTYIKLAERLGGIKTFGGQKPEWIDYANGSRLLLAGMDDPGKALSAERDGYYFNQCEELTVNDWEIVSTRATGRSGNMPWTMLLGDCNPLNPSHWTVTRKSLYVIKSYHKDNPTLFDDEGVITAQGIKSLGILSNLSEPRRSRLFLGLDASVEGAVYPEYDATIHLIDRFTIPNDWPRIRVIDFGFTNPFVCSWYAYDRATNRLYRYREIYQTQLLVEDAAKLIGECEGWLYNPDDATYTWLRPIREREPIIATICDWDSEDRATLERHGIPSIAAFKSVLLGIEAVKQRLKPSGKDGKPTVYFLRNSLVAIDPELQRQHKPTCTEEEIEGYVWKADKLGKPVKKEEPVKENDHGVDPLRYVVCFVDDIGSELDKLDETVTYDEEYQISPY